MGGVDQGGRGRGRYLVRMYKGPSFFRIDWIGKVIGRDDYRLGTEGERTWIGAQFGGDWD